MAVLDDYLADPRLTDPAFLATLTPNQRSGLRDAVVHAKRLRGDWQHDPVGWVRAVLGGYVSTQQAEILEAVRDHRRVVITSGNGVGKSISCARLICWWLDSFPDAMVISTAPTYPQIAAIVWKEVKIAHRAGNLAGRIRSDTQWMSDANLPIGIGRRPRDYDPAAFQGFHCLAEDHEILTRRGWLGPDDLTTDDEVLSVPVDGETAEWMPVTAKHVYDFDGELNTYEGKQVSLAMTDEHRLPTQDQSNGAHWRLRTVAELQGKHQFTLRRRSGWKGEGFTVPEPFAGYGWTMEHFARFLGFWIGDGGLREHSTGRFYEVLLYQSKEAGTTYMETLLAGLQVGIGRDYVSLSNRAAAEWLLENVGRYQVDRRIPRFMLDAPPEALDALVEALWKADGNKRKDGSRGILYNSSAGLMDDVQEVLVKLGRPSTLGVNVTAGRTRPGPFGAIIARHDVLTLSWVGSPADHVVKTDRMKRVPYVGRVWCVSTPHETFYTRRHGKVSISGNSRHVLVVIDECAGVPAVLWEGAEKLTTGPQHRILAVGNPDHEGSYFHQQYMSPSWHSARLSVLGNPHFTGEPCPPEVLAMLTHPSWVQDRAERFGVGSPTYQRQVTGEFPPARDDVLIPRQWLYGCVHPDQAKKLGPLLREPAKPVVLFGERAMPAVQLGVDVAAGGGDQTVVYERRGNRLGRRWSIDTNDSEQIVDLVAQAVDATGADTVAIDAIGVGFGVAGSLQRRRPSLNVLKIVVSESPWPNPESDWPDFKNRRSQLWWMARELSRLGKWDLTMGAYDEAGIPRRDSTLIDDLSAFPYEEKLGKVIVASKDTVREELGRSPDDGDAAILAFTMEFSRKRAIVGVDGGSKPSFRGR